MPLLILQKYVYENRYSTDFFLISDGLGEKLCYMSFNTSYTSTINHTFKIPYAWNIIKQRFFIQIKSKLYRVQ